MKTLSLSTILVVAAALTQGCASQTASDVAGCSRQVDGERPSSEAEAVQRKMLRRCYLQSNLVAGLGRI